MCDEGSRTYACLKKFFEKNDRKLAAHDTYLL